MLLDWFLQPASGTSPPFELVAPGNRRFFFGTQDVNGNWHDNRDPEMLGATLNVPTPGLSDQRYWIVWKDGTKWYFNTNNNGLSNIIDPHGTTIVASVTRDGPTGVCWQVTLGGPNSHTIFYHQMWPYALVDRITLSYDGNTAGGLDRTWNLAYNGASLASITDPGGGVTRFTWGSYTRDDGAVVPELLTLTNPRGNTVYTNQYDSLGRVVKQTYADGGYLTASYPAGAIGSSGTTTVTDPRGGVRKYGCVWEPAVNGHLEGYHFANFTDALGRTTQWNQLHSGSYLDTQIIDYRSRITTLGWDYNKANLTSKSWTTPLGATASESWGYDPNCSVCTSATDALGRTATNSVNAYGDILSSTDARANTTHFTRDSYGNPTAVTNALNQTTNMTYGSYSELLTTTDPLTHTTTRTYDAASRLASSKDANNKTVSFTYNFRDQLLTQSQVVNGQTLTTTNVYDAGGNRV
jgi:YD repeat-containing protein